MKVIIIPMSQTSMLHMVVLLLFCNFTIEIWAMGWVSGPSLRQATIIFNQPRSVLRTKMGLGEMELELSMSSSCSSSEEDDEEEDDEEKEKDTKNKIHISPEVKAANEILNSPGFEDVRKAYDNFHRLLQDVLTSVDPLPTLQRISELAADMSDKHLLYEFLEKREYVKRIWQHVETKLDAAKVALAVYGRVVTEKANEALRKLYENDSQTFKEFKTTINKDYVPIYVKVVEPEPYTLFRARLGGMKLEKWWALERDNFYDELLGAEAFLGALRIDLDNLMEWKRKLLMEVDFEKFTLKIDNFVREKQQFLALLENLGGRLRQVRMALRNYWVYSRITRQWEESFLNDEAKFKALKDQIQKMESNIPSTLFKLDDEFLYKAKVYLTNPEKLPEILNLIIDLEVKYSRQFHLHVWSKSIHHIYYQLYRAKVQLNDYEVIHQKADACNEAFNKARNLEKWSFEELKRARHEFYKLWNPKIPAIRLFETALSELGKAAEETGGEAWKRLVTHESTFLNSYKNLSLMAPHWTISALADYYDQKYDMVHRRAYRDIIKMAEQKSNLALVTLSTVKALQARLNDGPAQAQYTEARKALGIQLEQAKDFYRCIRRLPRFKNYWDAKRDDKEAEAFKVDAEQFRNLNRQLNDLDEETAKY